MIKRLATAVIVGFLSTSAALAQTAAQGDANPAPAPATTSALPETPATAEACMEAAANLSSAAEGKAFTDDKLDRLEQLFSKMETLCDGKQFAEAMVVGNDIKTILDVK